MSSYETLFEALRDGVRDDAPGSAVQEMLSALGPDGTAEVVAEFCRRAGSHVDEVGADVVGKILWHWMGSRWQVWWTVAKASPEKAEAAVLSLRDLYEGCFAKHLKTWSGGGGKDELANACYMLWDLEGGLDRIPVFEEPKHLVGPCYDVIEHALALESPPCWESALHGLGHIVFSHPEPAHRLIDAFLAAKGKRLPDEVRGYAGDAQRGMVQ